MFPLKPRLNYKTLFPLFFFIVSFLLIKGFLLDYSIAKGTEPTMPETTVSKPTIHQSLKTLARSPHAYHFISQHDTEHPTVYCAPTVLAMAFSPFFTNLATRSPAAYVETFAKHLKTCRTYGTTVHQVLDGLDYFNTKDALSQEWDDVWYQGIHKVPAHYYHNRKHQAQWATLNADVLDALNTGGVVMAHLGWYVEKSEQKRFVRKGGHYVLVTGVFESPELTDHYYVEFMDPLDTSETFHSRSPRYRLDLRSVSKEQKTFKVVDPYKQFRSRQVGSALFQPTPPPGKKDEVLTILEGFVVLTKHSPL
jgi:hypothetical protein